jgi:HEAT repeat protein
MSRTRCATARCVAARPRGGGERRSRRLKAVRLNRRWLLAWVFVLVATAPLSAQTFLKKDAAAWLKELGAAEEATRRHAAFALGKLGNTTTAVVPGLRQAVLKDTSPKVREAAAFALGELARESIKAAGDPQLVTTLSAALKDEHWQVRRSAAYALGCLEKESEPAQAALEGLLRDAYPEVRQNAAWALGKINLSAIPKLQAALRDTDALVKRDAALSLGQFEPEPVRVALNDLLGLCKDPSGEVRRAVVGVLIRIVGPEDAQASAPLRALLADGDEEVRRNAALALSNIGGKDAAAATPVLVDALHRGDLELRRQAAAALRNLGPEAARAVPDLVQVLRDPDVELRANAAVALGGIGPAAEKAVPALVELTANAKEKIAPRIEAAVALSRIGPVPAAIEAAPRLLQVMSDASHDANVRWRIVWALRVHNVNLRKMAGVAPAFAKVLAEPKTEANRMLRYDCAYILGVLEGDDAPKETLDTLADFLKDDKVTIYVGTQATVQGAGQETGTGKATVKELGKGDGRTMATQALKQFSAARLRARTDIVQQLQALARDQATAADLRKECQELLKSIGR